MLRIVEISPASQGRGGYVVLQNCGPVSIELRGWALCSDAYFAEDTHELTNQIYVFRAEVSILPYTRVVLFCGAGKEGWLDTVDGRKAYCAYWNTPNPIWQPGAKIHLLHLHATHKVPSQEAAFAQS